jgi:hypothetical protein
MRTAAHADATRSIFPASLRLPPVRFLEAVSDNRSRLNGYPVRRARAVSCGRTAHICPVASDTDNPTHKL